jgi:hypothetical protein
MFGSFTLPYPEHSLILRNCRHSSSDLDMVILHVCVLRTLKKGDWRNVNGSALSVRNGVESFSVRLA